jgi:hypothetical protein
MDHEEIKNILREALKKTPSKLGLLAIGAELRWHSPKKWPSNKRC